MKGYKDYIGLVNYALHKNHGNSIVKSWVFYNSLNSLQKLTWSI